MGIEELTTFFGWLTVINVAVFTLSAVMLMLVKDKVAPLHAKMFSLKEEDILLIYFKYLGQFKIMIIVFNLAPYIALRMMG